MKSMFAALALVIASNCYGSVDLVKVDKSEKRMYLLDGNKTVKVYNIALGANPEGHKIKKDDEKTPEGRYELDSITKKSDFYRSMHVSYPNEKDKAAAKKAGVKPGGDIMIHGQKNYWGWASMITQLFNWTDGCIAITNSEMDEFLELVSVGTPIQINP